MAEIKPLKGMRYTAEGGNLETLVCPPYDIISDLQREKFIDDNPYNIIRLELPKGDDNRYKVAGDTLKLWLENGILAQDEKECIYVYEMSFRAGGTQKSVKGFVSLVKLEEFSKGIVLPHEETLSKAKTDRFNLMSETFCNFSQIYSLYMDENGSAYNLVDNCSQGDPDMQVTDSDGVIHSMWCVSDKEVISKLTDIFADKKLYIADGHHRYETALNFHKHLCETGISNDSDLSGYIMMMLVNMENDGLVVLPTHRIVRGLENFNINEIFSPCSDYFEIEKVNSRQKAESLLQQKYSDGKKAFALYNGEYHVMTLMDTGIVKNLMPDMSDAYCGLDVSVLHSLVLEKFFGIDKDNMAKQINLTYTKVADEAIAAVDSGKANCCFLLNPTKVSEIKDVAAAKEKMPQKSTYFYPKTITGLVMNKFR